MGVSWLTVINNKYHLPAILAKQPLPPGLHQEFGELTPFQCNLILQKLAGSNSSVTGYVYQVYSSV